MKGKKKKKEKGNKSSYLLIILKSSFLSTKLTLYPLRYIHLKALPLYIWTYTLSRVTKI